MPLSEGQVQVRDLVMGRGTAYKVTGFNPWNRSARVTGSGDNPWDDGGYAGAEFREVVAVNMDVTVRGVSAADWWAKHVELDAAFAPIGTGPEVELRWVTGGIEFVMFGRPRGLGPEIKNLRTGRIANTASFSALDPSIYSSTEYTVSTGLPAWSGGLTVPVTTPLLVAQTQTSGIITATNSGKAVTALYLRIDGPVTDPTITVVGPDAIPYTLSLETVIEAGQWISIDTKAQSVLLNDSITRLSSAYGSWPLLQPGVSTVTWRATTYDPTAQLTARWRDRW